MSRGVETIKRSVTKAVDYAVHQLASILIEVKRRFKTLKTKVS